MKKKFTIILTITGILAIGLFFLSPNREQSKLESLPKAVAIPSSVVSNNVSKDYVHKQAETNVMSKPASEQAALTPAPHASLVEAMRMAIEAKNIQFSFYGKAIDQDSNVLSGVSFDIWARHWDPDSTAPIHITKNTDVDGRFDIHGIGGVIDLPVSLVLDTLLLPFDVCKSSQRKAVSQEK